MKIIINKILYIILLLLPLSACRKQPHADADIAKEKIVVNALEEGIIKSTIAKINAQCPIVLDFIVTLDKAEFEAPRTIVYYYTANLNSTASEAENIKESIKTNLEYEVFYGNKFGYLKDIGATFKFVYKTQDGDFFMRYIIEPDDYKKIDSESSNRILTDEEVYKLLVKTANVLNKQLPRTIEDVILYKIEAIAPRTLKFNYRFENIDKKDLTPEAIDEFKNNVLSSKIDDEKLLKDNNVIFQFSYSDKNDILVFSIEITPEDYK